MDNYNCTEAELLVYLNFKDMAGKDSTMKRAWTKLSAYYQRFPRKAQSF